jgi:hypothetical protein
MESHRPESAPRRSPPVWIPWLLAPAFTLLPIAGCGAAAALRHAPGGVATAPGPAAGPPLVPVTTVATMLPPGR